MANLLGQIIANPQRNDIVSAKNLKIISAEMFPQGVPIKSKEAWNKFWMMYERNYTLDEKKDLIGSAKSGARQVIGQTTSEMAK